METRLAFDEIVESSEPVLIPQDIGLEASPDITGWPWPRLVSTAYHTFVFMEGDSESLLLYELTLDASGVWNGEHVGTVGNIYGTSTVEVVDFGHYYVVLVGGPTPRNFAKLINEELVELAVPLFSVGCNNNGQFVGGNVRNWQDLGSDGIAWSGIGVYEFDPARDQTAGFKTLVTGRQPGKRVTIHKIMKYMDGIIIYTDFGNVFLTDRLIGSTFVYGLGDLEGFGVASGNHVAGNTYVQMFINMNNELCKYQKSKELKILGFKRQLEELQASQTPILVNFLEDRNTFFISNGVSTLVVNDYGAGMVHQAVSGLVKAWDERLYGTYRDFGDTEARITLEGSPLDSRGKKTLEWIIADIDHEPTTRVSASSYWRNAASDTWRSHVWKSGSPSGEFFTGLSAVEYRVALRFSHYVGSGIFGLKLNTKYPDARTRRGVASISGVTSGDTQASS